jgi:hypothetical protein
MEDTPRVVPAGAGWKLLDPAAVRKAIGDGAKLVEKKFKTKAEAERHLAARTSGEAVAPPTEAEIASKYKHVVHDGKHRLFIGAKMMEFDTEAEMLKKKAALVKAALKKAKSAA